MTAHNDNYTKENTQVSDDYLLNLNVYTERCPYKLITYCPQTVM